MNGYMEKETDGSLVNCIIESQYENKHYTNWDSK